MEPSHIDHNDLTSPFLLSEGREQGSLAKVESFLLVQKNKKKNLYGISLFLLLCFSVFFCNNLNNDRAQHAPEQMEVRVHHDDDKHNGPTLLSIVDKSNRLIPAVSHVLYKMLESAHFEIPQSSAASVELVLDRKKISFSHPLQVSWKTISDDTTVHDTDILALYCDSHPKSLLPSKAFSTADFSKPREAATIAQVKSSSRFHNPMKESSVNFDDETWYIPSFPTIREKKCHFRLWRGEPKSSNDNNLSNGKSNEGSTTLSLLSISEDLHLPPLDTPTAIHLSLTNNPEEMVVQFTTGTNGQPLVEVVHPNNTMSLHFGTSTTYSNEDLCQEPANSTSTGNFIPPGNLHTVLVDNLIPSMEYKYRVGLKFISDEENIPTVKESYDDIYYSFVTVPPIGSKDDEPFAFIVYGDQGCPEDGWAMGGNMSANMIKRELDEAVIPIKAVHHFGDLSYARGNAHLWDAWHDMIFDVTTRVPLLVGVGNHEYDHTAGGTGKDPSGEIGDAGFHPIWGNFGKDSGGECGVPTSKRFFTPQNGNGVFWYSYDIGLVHTIMVSSEHSLSKGSRQYTWLEDNLKRVDRNLTPWIIIESHRPMYIGERTSPEEFVVGRVMRYEFEDLLIQYKVDLLLAGHFHSYFRSCQGLYQSKCNNGGLTHIVVGTAGAPLTKSHEIHHVDWVEEFIKDWGYGKIIVYNSTVIHWSFISSHGDNEGKIMDEVWIKKETE